VGTLLSCKLRERQALRGLAATVREIKEEEDKYGRESNLASLYALHERLPLRKV